MGRSQEQIEHHNRYRNCKNWAENYNIYIDVNDLENYLWFKQNKTLVKKLIPLADKLRELQTPIDERSTSQEDTPVPQTP